MENNKERIEKLARAAYCELLPYHPEWNGCKDEIIEMIKESLSNMKAEDDLFVGHAEVDLKFGEEIACKMRHKKISDSVSELE